MSATREWQSTHRPSSIVLTDWAADVDHLRADRHGVIYQLLLLSLLYDQVLLQDELLVLSNALAEWFGQRDGQRIWNEVLDVGSLVILRHPISEYPTKDLKEYAQEHPLHARAKYIEEFGAKDDQHFQPAPIQKAFYSSIEMSLARDTRASREVGALRKMEIMPRFATTLDSVLRHPNVPWFKATFPALSPNDVAQFHKYVGNPSLLVKELARKGATFNVVPDPKGQPTFNRALAYQAAGLFSATKEAAFRRLIQSAFALPFCWREDAVGRYGGILNAVPPRMIRATGRRRRDSGSVTVEAHVNIPLPMPKLEPGFAKAIGRVRESSAGRHLRETVARLGRSLSFEQQKACWAAVAEELATSIAAPFHFGVSLDSIGCRLVEGALIGAVVHQALESQANQHEFLISPVGLLAGEAHAACGIVFDAIRDLWKVEMARADLRTRLEGSVEFRCIWIPDPEDLGETQDDATA